MNEAEDEGRNEVEQLRAEVARLSRENRQSRDWDVYLERVEETADRLGWENNELRLQLSNQGLQVTRLTTDLAEARRIGRWLYDNAAPGLRIAIGDVSEWQWLLEDDGK